MGEEHIRKNDSVEHENAQRLFRAVFEHTQQFMGILSSDGTVLDANRTALNFLGLKIADVVGKPFWETAWWAHSPKSQERVREGVQQAARGENVRFDTEHVDGAGRTIIVDFSLTPVLDESGFVKLIIPEGRDITERINSARSLSEREARTRAIVDTAPDGIATITMGGVIESANTSMHKLFKYPNGDLVGKPVSEILEFFFGEDTYVQDSLKTGERKIFGVGRETTGMKKDGRKFPVEIALSLLNLGHNRIFIAVIRDITERKKSQQLQAQLAAIVEGSGDAIVGIDIDGVIVSWNPAAELLYGYRSIEALGRPIGIVIPSDKLSQMNEQFAGVLNGDAVGHFETVLHSKFGALLDVDLTMSPIRNAQGVVVGISTIARDISLRKEADRRISEFYSTVSHELRTPLASIRASLGLLEGGVAGVIGGDALQLVEIARAESDRLIRLINDILDLRKIESGKLELKLKLVRLSDMLRTLLDSMRPMADEHQVKITLEKDESVDYMVMDRDRVIQVLANLLSNGIKFSPRGETITLAVADASPAQSKAIRFTVADKGPGIKEDDMHKLFGKFQQLDSSDTRAKGGTGLGLAICKAIVEQHGGIVGVDSVPGIGSSFWFELPIVELPTAVPLPEAKQHSPRTRRDGPVQVVIIEDDKSTLDLLERQLEPLGLNCFAASDGISALQLVREKHPDLIILDIGVPAPDGFEIVKTLRTEFAARTPLIVYTSLDLSETDKTCLTLGVSRHLVKSRTSQEDFLSAVRELVSEEENDEAENSNNAGDASRE